VLEAAFDEMITAGRVVEFHAARRIDGEVAPIWIAREQLGQWARWKTSIQVEKRVG